VVREGWLGQGQGEVRAGPRGGYGRIKGTDIPITDISIFIAIKIDILVWTYQ
jgi:hypothetical protein